MTITTDRISTACDVDQIVTADVLGKLDDVAALSGIARGIVAAGVLGRMVPDGVQIEEYNLGGKRATRGVFLHDGGADQIALYFLDATAEVSVHIQADGTDEAFDRFIPAAEMFEVVRAYYRI